MAEITLYCTFLVEGCQCTKSRLNIEELITERCASYLGKEFSSEEGKNGGREGDRTLGPRIANAVLSQLSYSPPVWRLENAFEAALI
jgi:hypothetical protein